MKIRMLVMDVDGTLTDGKIYIGNEGEIMKAFHVKDGYAIARLPEFGIRPVIITGRHSAIVAYRAEELGIHDCIQGVKDKLSTLKVLAEKYHVEPEEIAYIGDDLNDLLCMKWCGLSACPADAVQEVREEAGYVCKENGGCGAVREYIEWIRNT